MILSIRTPGVHRLDALVLMHLGPSMYLVSVELGLDLLQHREGLEG